MEIKKLLNQLGLSEYIAFDFETTGLSSDDDRIIEIAAIKFIDGNPVDRFVTLVNPQRPIDPFITDITDAVVIGDENIIEITTCTSKNIFSGISSIYTFVSMLIIQLTFT